MEKKPAIRGLYAVIDSTYVPPSKAGETARLLSRAGARIIQLRAKEQGGRDMLFAARGIRDAIKGSGAAFIVNDRVDVALLSGADGVHIGQGDLPLSEARGLLGPQAIIGISTHNEEEALTALYGGADYISLGPVYPTRTKKDAEEPKGIGALKAVCSSVKGLPVVAIGGITESNMEDALLAGASAVAVISEILLAPDMEGKAGSIAAKAHRQFYAK